MKKLFFVFAFLGCLGLVNVNAQGTCPYSKKAATTSVEKKACAKTCAKTAAAAAKLASIDDSIEAKTCATSGNVSYYQKSTCAKSGKVSMNEVTYDASAQKFVNASPVAAEAKNVSAKKKACSKSCAKKCAKGKKAAATSTEGDAKVKLIKMEEN